MRIFRRMIPKGGIDYRRAEIIAKRKSIWMVEYLRERTRLKEIGALGDDRSYFRKMHLAQIKLIKGDQHENRN